MKLADPGTREAILTAVTEQLSSRLGGVFGRGGASRAREHAEASLTALGDDLAADSREAARTSATALIERLIPEGLSFSDLRAFNLTLRKCVREVVPEDDPARARIEAWFYDLLMICTVRYIVWRDEQLQQQAVAAGIERVDAQLAELEVALEEKTELLELIRQASTPIAPVVRGILVVPLVGTFDAFRAELLTERLLSEITRLHARAAILDISGVPVFDTGAGELIIRLARSVRLLGAEVFLVGMSPGNAQTIVELGVDLSKLETLASLQEGLARALSSQGMKIVKT